MRRMLFLLPLLAAIPSFAVSVGEPYDQVIAEKGQPIGTMDSGTTRVATFSDVTIKFRNDVLVSIRTSDRALAVPATSPVPSHRGSPAGSYTGEAVWESDLETAVSQAKARKCNILVLYTGSDWCPWCRKMDAEVYSQPEFAQYSHEKLVLLKLDFLRHTPQSDQAKAQNAEMAKRYDVRAYPTVVVIDANGKALGRIVGYHEGGSSGFISMLRAYR